MLSQKGSQPEEQGNREEAKESTGLACDHSSKISWSTESNAALTSKRAKSVS